MADPPAVGSPSTSDVRAHRNLFSVVAIALGLVPFGVAVVGVGYANGLATVGWALRFGMSGSLRTVLGRVAYWTL